jgi:hypothetical protein
MASLDLKSPSRKGPEILPTEPSLVKTGTFAYLRTSLGSWRNPDVAILVE